MNFLVGDSHSGDIKFNNYIYLSCSGGSAKGLNIHYHNIFRKILHSSLSTIPISS